MTKSETTQSETTGTKPIRESTYVINGSWSFKGLDEGKNFDISVAFFDWCNEVEIKYGVVCTNARSDYNADWRTDRTRTKE